MLNELGIYDVAGLTAATIGFVTMIRTALTFNSKWTPLVAVAVANLFTFLWGLQRGVSFDSGETIAEAILIGTILVGFGAAGAVSSFKNVSQAVQMAAGDGETELSTQEQSERPAPAMSREIEAGVSWSSPDLPDDRLYDDFGNPITPLTEQE